MNKRSFGVSIAITFFFALTLYTTSGCGWLLSPTEPEFHFAQIAGIVTDAVTGAPIANATVTLLQTGSPAIPLRTGTDGRYSMGALTPGENVRVDVVATGHQPFTTTVRLAEGNNTLDIKLQPI